MGILDRTSTILRANVNALLDQAEDPEKTLDQLLRDMGDTVTQARGQVAEMIAQQKLLENDRDTNARLAQDWGAKAELAVGRGADDLAKEALRRKIDFGRNAEAYAGQAQAQADVVTKLKADLAQLEAKYESTVSNRDALISRHRAAVAQQTVSRAANQLSGMDSTSDLGRMEERIRLEEARAAAGGEADAHTLLEDQFTALQGDDEVDLALKRLQTEVRGRLAAPVAPDPAAPAPAKSPA